MSPTCWAIGDPQTTFETFLHTLRSSGLLTDADRLRPDVRLLSMGDHFDFKPPEGWSLQQVAAAGEQILSWLASHPPEQVTILMGNHDLCRVMELYRMSDADFAHAQQVAAGSISKEDFLQQFPDLPSKGIATRDFSAFRVVQRTMVQQLLLSGRAKLAAVITTPSGDVGLATHAGVTHQSLQHLGLAGVIDPVQIAHVLNELLVERVEQVRAQWHSGQFAQLDLSPVHRMGVANQEGGGLLYHRPMTKPAKAWHRKERRYSPLDLPVGLLQVCGHTQHKKCMEMMPSQAGMLPFDEVGGQLRFLAVRDGEISYGVGLKDPEPSQATMWMTDGGMHVFQSMDLLALHSIEDQYV